MLALIVPELIDLLRVAGETGFRDIPGKGNVQRSVRILMTTEASLEFVVRLFPCGSRCNGEWASSR